LDLTALHAFSHELRAHAQEARGIVRAQHLVGRWRLAWRAGMTHLCEQRDQGCHELRLFL
jgi:hypothetical protein